MRKRFEIYWISYRVSLEESFCLIYSTANSWIHILFSHKVYIYKWRIYSKEFWIHLSHSMSLANEKEEHMNREEMYVLIVKVFRERSVDDL